MTATTQLEAPVDAALSRPKPRRQLPTRRIPGPLGALRLVILWGFALFCVVPILWLFLAPTKTNAQLRDDFPLSFGSLQTIGAAWNDLFEFSDGIIVQWTINSLVYVAAGMFGAIATSLLAGYALAILPFPGRKAVLWATVIAMVMPGIALLFPTFLELNAMGLIDSMLGVIFTTVCYPFGVYLGFTYFSTTIPREVVEAARMDGASEVRIFLSIGLPLAKPLIALMAYFSFVGLWNDFYHVYFFITSEENYNLPVGLGALMAVSGVQGTTPGEPLSQTKTALAAVIIVLPMLLLFAFVQRYFNTALLGGVGK